MKIKCKKKTLTKKEFIEYAFFKDASIINIEHVFSVNIGEVYLVMGIGKFRDYNCIMYLIDVNGVPIFYPSHLFEILDNSIPEGWYFRIFSSEGATDSEFLFGFDELCNSATYFEDLFDVDYDANLKYFKRKIELEKYYDDLEYLK